MISGRKSANRPRSAPSAGLDHVETPAELAEQLAWLRAEAGLSLKDVSRAAGPGVLSVSTVSDLCTGRSVPRPETLRAYLLACGVSESELGRWQAARGRAEATGPRPDGSVQVGDADPYRLGVHHSIQVRPGGDGMPSYVPRDLDAELRTALSEGGMVLLKGMSSVGKTRAMLEGVRATMPGWWLLHPSGTPAIEAFARASAPRTVLWLDELERYLDAGLTEETVRALLAAGVVVAATMWREDYDSRTTARVVGQPDLRAGDRRILQQLARVIDVADNFTAAERDRTVRLASTDPRLRAALDSTDAGITQVLAAGPDLVDRWENGGNVHGKAVITAALDARRVGAHSPLTREFLERAAPAYLDDRQRGKAPPDDWFDAALAYATAPLHGAAACLTPQAATIGRIDGYTVADYLYQHAYRIRRTEPLPASVWQALTAHHHADDTIRLADSAERRGQPGHATALFATAASTDTYAAGRLAELLARQGDLNELRRHAGTGNEVAADHLAGLLAKLGLIDELRQRADDGQLSAGLRLAELLARQGHVDELRERAAAGDRHAAIELSRLLTGRGRRDEAIAVMRRQADTGNKYAAGELAHLLYQRGSAAELRQRADAGDEAAANWLALLLSAQGRIKELSRRAEAGDHYAAQRMARLLTEQGRVEETIALLRRCADGGDGYAAMQLAPLLAEHGHLDELRRRADDGDTWAGDWLVVLLAQQGNVEETRAALRRCPDGNVAERAARNALDLPDGVEAAITIIRIHRSDDEEGAVVWAAGQLSERGRAEEAITSLRRVVDGGNEGVGAAEQLANLLAGQGRIDEGVEILRRHVDAGSSYAAIRLASLLMTRGRTEEAITVLRGLADGGIDGAAWELGDLLAGQDRVDEAVEILRHYAGAGGKYAATSLARLLEKQGHTEEAMTVLRGLADGGDDGAAGRLADLLAGQGRIDEAVEILRHHAGAGSKYAAKRLVSLLAEHGRADELGQELHAGTLPAWVYREDRP